MNILASAFSCLRVPIPLELVSRSGLAGVMGICIKISICCCLVDTLCLFCNPMDCSPQAPPKQEYWSGWPFPSSAVFRTQGSNLGLLHCRQILFRLSRLSHQGTETQKFTDFPTWWVNDRVAMCHLMRRTPGRTRQSWTLFSTLSPRAHLVISEPWDITRLVFFSLLSLRPLRGSETSTLFHCHPVGQSAPALEPSPLRNGDQRDLKATPTRRRGQSSGQSDGCRSQVWSRLLGGLAQKQRAGGGAGREEEHRVQGSPPGAARVSQVRALGPPS